MSVTVIITKTLEDWWGADDCLRDGGVKGVIELIMEDISAFVDNTKIEVRGDEGGGKESE